MRWWPSHISPPSHPPTSALAVSSVRARSCFHSVITGATPPSALLPHIPILSFFFSFYAPGSFQWPTASAPSFALSSSSVSIAPARCVCFSRVYILFYLLQLRIAGIVRGESRARDRGKGQRFVKSARAGGGVEFASVMARGS